MENDDKAVASRYNKNGDFTTMNSWYSNLTPFVDDSQTLQQVPRMFTEEEKVRYNDAWLDLKCPSQKSYETLGATGGGQGIMVTYAYYVGGGNAKGPNGESLKYEDGYGLFNLQNGESRKLVSVRQPSETMAFVDMKDQDYFYVGNYSLMTQDERYDIDWFFPLRHGDDYMVTYADGHSDKVDKKYIRDADLEYYNDRLWKTD